MYLVLQKMLKGIQTTQRKRTANRHVGVPEQSRERTLRRFYGNYEQRHWYKLRRREQLYRGS